MGTSGGAGELKAPYEGEEGSPSGGKRSRSGFLLWVLGGLVVLALVVGAVLGATRGPQAMRPDTPEAAVQGYLQAVVDGEHRRAAGYLSAGAAQRCTPSAFRDAWVPPSLSATLEEVRAEADGAEVRVRLRSASGPPPFGGGSFAFVETFALVRESGGWRIDDDPWPVFCGKRA